MSLFNRLKGPVFYKNDSDAERQLAQLEAMLEKASGETAKAIKREIVLVQAGIDGEKQVRFELENSHIPMYVLHDLYLEHNGLTSQIDYLIITRGHQFVIECKNLYGDIEINENGDFIRNFSYGSFHKKEGIYSPITQNRRHMELIKQIRSEQRSVLLRGTFEKNFFQNYRSVVVLSNPKTVLNVRRAKKEIRSQVIRADQLAEYIRKVDAEPGTVFSSDKQMEDLAKFFMDICQPNPTDYTAKYLDLLSAEPEPDDTTPQKNEQEEQTPPAESKEELTAQENAQEEQPQITEPKQTEEPSVDSEQKEEVLCPRCGAPMIKRQAQKGKNAGKFFYGCSNYPKCWGIINIE